MSTGPRGRHRYRPVLTLEADTAEGAAAAEPPRLQIACTDSGPEVSLDLGFELADSPTITSGFDETGAGTRRWRVATQRRAVFVGARDLFGNLYAHPGFWVRVEAPGRPDIKLFFDLARLQRAYPAPEDICGPY